MIVRFQTLSSCSIEEVKIKDGKNSLCKYGKVQDLPSQIPEEVYFRLLIGKEFQEKVAES